MNKLIKSPEPKYLAGHAPAATSTIIATAKAKNGQLSNADFNSAVYNGSDVKDTLLSDQHYKCAYCERKKSGDFGNVEHYRPKAGYNIQRNNPIIKPGYYWLTYDWANMLFACDECNTKYKKNLFPLLDESKRDITNCDITKEEPGIINPYNEDPADNLVFAQHVIKPRIIDGVPSKKGELTIESLGLNDNAILFDERQKAWLEYKSTCTMLTIAQMDGASMQLIQMLTDRIANYTDDSTEFCCMFKNQE